AWRFRLNYKRHLDTLVRRADRAAGKILICVFGLINFEAFFEARLAMESARCGDPKLYPFLEVGYRTFPSMKPEFRGLMIVLARKMNQHLEELVVDIRKRV